MPQWGLGEGQTKFWRCSQGGVIDEKSNETIEIKQSTKAQGLTGRNYLGYFDLLRTMSTT